MLDQAFMGRHSGDVAPDSKLPSFYEFFAGGGMARAGLGRGWTCLFANDFDEKKSAVYRLNYPDADVLRVDDVRNVKVSELPGCADLVWGSFPCQDLSLAGGGAGLNGGRSGTFHPFWQIVTGLAADGRRPKVVAIENVLGTLTSHGGRDFAVVCKCFADAGYRYGALVIDAALFLPQSRPRLFVIGVSVDVAVDPSLLAQGPIEPFHTAALQRACQRVEGSAGPMRVWWNLPVPPPRSTTFADLVEEHPEDVEWHSDIGRDLLIEKMSAVNKAKLEAAKRAGRRVVGCVYKRTRLNELGAKVQRAEVRFDGVAGCLRTPGGGSSRQVILVVDGNNVRSRLFSSREAARLMGLAESYRLPRNYNQAYHLAGDGVAPPVVRHLADRLFEPLLSRDVTRRAAA